MSRVQDELLVVAELDPAVALAGLEKATTRATLIGICQRARSQSAKQNTTIGRPFDADCDFCDWHPRKANVLLGEFQFGR